jgi:putative transposase
VVLDTFSRRIVGWSIDSQPAASLVTNALGMAIEQRDPQDGKTGGLLPETWPRTTLVMRPGSALDRLGTRPKEGPMRKSKFSEEQIIRALRRLEDGTAAGELCRKLGVSQATLYRWKRKYAGLGVSELRELKQLRDENRRLKQVVADLTLDKDILQEAVKRKW